MLQVEDWVYNTEVDTFGKLQSEVESGVWSVVCEGDNGRHWDEVWKEYDLELVCPFCPNSTVDSDYRACPSCREVI